MSQNQFPMKIHLAFGALLFTAIACTPATPFEDRHENGNLKETGFLRDTVRTDLWAFYDAQGRLDSTGTYKKGQRHGEWSFYYDHGKLAKRGSYKKGRENGPWVFYHSNGALDYEGTYKNGYLDGEYTFFHNNDSIRKVASYDVGNDTGYAKTYDRLGRLTSEYSLKMGEENWEYDGTYVSYYWNGDTLRFSHYRLGKSHGRSQEWHKNGQLRYDINFIDGLQDGTTTSYHEDGSVEAEVEFSVDRGVGHYLSYHENGKKNAEGAWVIHEDEWVRNGNWTFLHENGKTQARGFFSNGIKDKHWEYFDDDGVKTSESDHSVVQSTTTSTIYHEGSTKVKETVRTVLIDDEWKKDGPVHGKHKNGKPSFDGTFEEGERVGSWKWFHEDGTLQELAFYTKGILTGDNEQFSEDGVKTARRVFNYQTGSGKATYYYDNGQEKYTSDLILFDGEWNEIGDYTYYHEDGWVQVKGSIDSTLYHLDQTFYFESGKEKVLRHQIRVEGEWLLNDTITYYYENGQLSAAGTYFEGLQSNYYINYNEMEDQPASAPDYDISFRISKGTASLNTYFNDGTKIYQGDLMLNDSVWVRSGNWEFYNEDKRLTSKGMYKEGKPDGLWESWDENGDLQSKTEYNLEDEYALRTFYQNGRKSSTVEMKLLDGSWEFYGTLTFYHDNGRKQSEGQYRYGKRRGTWTYWNELGRNLGTNSY